MDPQTEIQKSLDTANRCAQRAATIKHEVARQTAFLTAATARLEALPTGAPSRGRRERALKKTIKQKTRKVYGLTKDGTALDEERETALARAAELQEYLDDIEAQRVRDAEREAATAQSQVVDAEALRAVVEQTETERNSKEALAEALGVDPATIKDVNLDEKT